MQVQQTALNAVALVVPITDLHKSISIDPDGVVAVETKRKPVGPLIGTDYISKGTASPATGGMIIDISDCDSVRLTASGGNVEFTLTTHK